MGTPEVKEAIKDIEKLVQIMLLEFKGFHHPFTTNNSSYSKRINDHN